MNLSLKLGSGLGIPRGRLSQDETLAQIPQNGPG